VRVQSRSGCACAGPYGVSLMQPLIERIVGQTPEEVVRALEAPKNEWVKPGWMRVYFSHLMTPAEVDYVIRSVLEVAHDGWKLLPQYDCAYGSGACLLHSATSSLSAIVTPCTGCTTMLHSTGAVCCTATLLQVA
jgi:hypothetical protein